MTDEEWRAENHRLHERFAAGIKKYHMLSKVWGAIKETEMQYSKPVLFLGIAFKTSKGKTLTYAPIVEVKNFNPSEIIKGKLTLYLRVLMIMGNKMDLPGYTGRFKFIDLRPYGHSSFFPWDEKGYMKPNKK